MAFQLLRQHLEADLEPRLKELVDFRAGGERLGAAELVEASADEDGEPVLASPIGPLLRLGR